MVILLQNIRSYPLAEYYDTQEMDKIRARGFLKNSVPYDPPTDVANRIEKVAVEYLEFCAIDWKNTKLDDLQKKEKILTRLGNELDYFIPNSRLHKTKTLADLVEFYSTPASNITNYAQMARDKHTPKNISIREHPARFHPNDTTAPHGGVTAFPARGGEVYSIRSKRLNKQFKPKSDWFDFEDQSFDYEPLDKNMPWDPVMARKMDSYINTKFSKKSLLK